MSKRKILGREGKRHKTKTDGTTAKEWAWSSAPDQLSPCRAEC